MLDDPAGAYDSAAGLPAIPARRAYPLVVIEAFRPRVLGSLRGYADVAVPSDRLVVRGIAVCASGDAAWISLPTSVPEARPRFFDLPVRFLDDAGRRGFERAVLQAVRVAYPHALAGREAAS